MRPSHSLSHRPTHPTTPAKLPRRLFLSTSMSLLGLQTLFLTSPRAIAQPSPRPPAPIPERVLHLNPDPESYNSFDEPGRGPSHRTIASASDKDLRLTQIRSQADQLLQQGIDQYRVSQFQEALQSWQSALELYRELEDRAGEAKTLNNIGLVYRNLGDYPLALDFFQQSLLIKQDIGDRAGEAKTLNNIGIVYEKLGDYPQALDFFQQSLIISQDIGDRATEALTLNNIGIVYRLLGDYPQALDFYQQSLLIKQDIGDRATEALTLNNIGNVYQLLGDYPLALDFYQQSLLISQDIGDRAGEALTLGNIGNVYLLLGDYPLALDFYQQSLIIKQDIGDRAGEADTLTNLGSVYVSLNQDEQALESYQASLAIRQDIGDYAGEAFTLWGIALIHRRSGAYSEAITTYQQGLAVSREVGSRNVEADILRQLADVFEAQDQADLAIVFYKEAINTYEQIRASNEALEKSLQESYTATIEDTYRHLADLLLQRDRILEAQRVLDLLKVQELDNYLRGVRSSDETRSGTERLPAERVIINAHTELIDRAILNGKRLSELEEKEIQTGELTDAEFQELEALQAEQKEILQAFNEFKDSDLVQTQLDLLSPEELSRNVQLNQLAALRDNLGDIPKGAVMLYPLLLDDTLELVVTSADAPPFHRTIQVSRGEINDAVHAFRYALEEPDRDAVTPAQQLYRWLIAPIEADLQAAGIETIIYAPDRSLRYIPLAALHDGTQWLAERYRVNNITAASLTDLNTQGNTNHRILAGALTEGPVTVNVGDESYRFRLLEHADDEVSTISELTPNMTALFDGDFNPDRIERDVNRHTILHLATHAKFLVGQPEESFILFSNQERWTLADFNQGLLNLTRVDLVVLSACETGLDNTLTSTFETESANGNGEAIGTGAEILGFGYLMQTAGARASLSSLWEVDDGGTQILMAEFYEALIRGNLSKTEALRQAQRALIRMGQEGDRGGFEIAQAIGLDPNDLAHPHYWAPFVLIGNGL